MQYDGGSEWWTAMHNGQKRDQVAYSRKHRKGVVRRLDLILAEIEGLPEVVAAAVTAALAERQRGDQQEDARR